MTHWLDGTPLPWSDAHDVAEYRKGDVWVIGLRRGSRLLFTVRSWNEHGETVYTEPKLVADGVYPGTVKLFPSEKDGYFQLTCGDTAKWIKPQDIKEIPGPPPAPPPPDQKLIPEFHGHFLSFWQQFYLEAWPDDDALERTLTWARETVTETRSYGTSLLDGFLLLSCGTAEHALWNEKTPWVFRDGKFDLEQPNPRFWELYRRFLEMFRDYGHGMRWAPQLAMAGKYNLWPFRNNHQGIRVLNIWDRPTWPYLRQLGRLCCEAHRDVFGPDEKPWIKIINEAGHYDSHSAHEIMYCHQDVFEGELYKHLPLDNLIIDLTDSDYAQGGLVDPWVCVKQAACDQPPDFIHGKAEYGRRRVPESHAYSTLQDFTSPLPGRTDGKGALEIFLGSGNPRWRPTEDAGSWTRTARGVKWGPWQIATAEQTYEMAKYVLLRVKVAGKIIYIVLFPLETLDAGGYPRYQKRFINWARFAAFRRAWREVYEVK